MSMLSLESLASYWSITEVETNVIVFMNLLGAMLLGLLVGYERSYHGRAAGVIMKDGFTISGLTTAASIWAASATGVLIGVGFYAAGIMLAALSAVRMWVSRLEDWLPSHPAVAVVVRFRKDYEPREEVLARVVRDRGYELAAGSIAIAFLGGQAEWRFVVVASAKEAAAPLASLADELAKFDGIDSFNLSHARN